MRKYLSLAIILTMVISLLIFPSSAVEPTDVMYATSHTEGPVLPVVVDPYSGIETGNIYGHEERLDPMNVYGPFDATTTTGINEYFFGLASREWTNFTFEEDYFYNVDDTADIMFREVTWGSTGSWHAEGTLVFLTDAYVKNTEGDVVPYVPASEEQFGYFAGIAGNKEAILGFDETQKSSIRESFAQVFGVEGRMFYSNEVALDPAPDNTRATTLFYLPDEVVFAKGITLVDITDELWDYDLTVGNPSTYSNVSGTGRELTFVERVLDATDLLMGDRIEVTYGIGTFNGNTDGFDLDAIKVYKVQKDNICGFKLNSVTGEPVAGIKIILEKWNGEEYIWEDETETNEVGGYCFNDLLPGKYRVTEEATGWVQVYPADAHIVTLPSEDVVFGTQRSSGNIFKIDPFTADATQVLDTNIGFSNISPNGLAFDLANQELYYVTYPNAAKLYKSDLNGPTADDTLLGNLGHAVACADFFNGRYYFIAGGAPDGSTDDLYEVTFDAAGMVDQINAFPGISGVLNSAWTFNGDIAISPEGLIYGFGMTSGGTYEFFSVNRDGTHFQMIKSDGYSFSLQLAFNGDGTLVGHDAVGGRFFEVNVDTGAITLLGTDTEMLYTDLSSGVLTYNFENEPARECFDETAWAAQDLPGQTRFVPAPGNWATYIEVSTTDAALATEIDPLEFPLYAGQDHRSGDLLVYALDGNLFVKYVANQSDNNYKEGYCGDWTGISEFHLQVEDEFIGFEAVRVLNNKSLEYKAPIPGAFEYKDIFEDNVDDTGWINAGSIADFTNGDFFIAAHAVMWWCGYPCAPEDDLTMSWALEQFNE